MTSGSHSCAFERAAQRRCTRITNTPTLNRPLRSSMTCGGHPSCFSFARGLDTSFWSKHVGGGLDTEQPEHSLVRPPRRAVSGARDRVYGLWEYTKSYNMHRESKKMGRFLNPARKTETTRNIKQRGRRRPTQNR